MAASEIYDFLTTMTSDVNETLSISAQGIVSEESSGNQFIHMGDDGSEERVDIGGNQIFYVSFEWAQLSETNSGTIFDLYNNPAKARGKVNSFKWLAHDGHTYVVRFDNDLSRSGNAKSRYGLSGIRLRILGRIAD